MARLDPKPVDLVVGEISAWRCWQIRGDGLSSVAIDNPWYTNVPMKGDPGIKGQGVHAWKSKYLALKYGCFFRPSVIGKVDLWGDMVEHQLGYRAEYAKITEIHMVLPSLFERRGWSKEQKDYLIKKYNVKDGTKLTFKERTTLIGSMFVILVFFLFWFISAAVFAYGLLWLLAFIIWHL